MAQDITVRGAFRPSLQSMRMPKRRHRRVLPAGRFVETANLVVNPKIGRAGRDFVLQKPQRERSIAFPFVAACLETGDVTPYTL